MRTRRTARVAVLTAALVGAAIAMPTAANADGGGGFYGGGTGNGTTSSGGSGDGTISAGAGVNITVTSHGGGSGRTVAATPTGTYPPPPCWWSPIFSQADFDAIATDQGPQGPGEPGGQQLYDEGNAAIKQNQALDKTRKGTYFSPESGGSTTTPCNLQYNQAFPMLFVPFGTAVPNGAGIQTQDLAQIAYNRMRVTAPDVSYQPPATNQVVNLNTWVSFAAPLQPVSVTATLEPQYTNSATTTATPQSLQIEAVIPDGSANPALDPDASPQTCTYQFAGGAGGYSVAASKNDACNVMFHHVTGAGGHAAALFAKITWAVRWTPTDGPAPGGTALPDVYSYTTTPVNIKELQTVVVPNPKG